MTILDHAPVAASDPRVWRLAVAPAFDLRWNDRPISADVERWHQRLCTLAESEAADRARRLWHRRLRAASQSAADPLTTVNLGPGRRDANDLSVAIAVDACLGDAPAQALAWTRGDATLDVDIATAVPGSRGPDHATIRSEAVAIVDEWGPGAKGIVSIRVPESLHHRVINVVNDDNVVRFLDCTTRPRLTSTGRLGPTLPPERAADGVLAQIDAASPFASIRIWRCADRANALNIPDRLFELPTSDIGRALRAALPADVPESTALELERRALAVGDLDYARWLVRQVQRGACTFSPTDYSHLAGGRPTAPPLTNIDSALVEFAAHRRLVMRGPDMEVSIPDNTRSRELIERFPDALVRNGPIDGVAPGTLEVVLTHADRQRTAVAKATFSPADNPLRTPAPTPAPARNWSWIETNRVVSPGIRKTNCWNTAAAIANYLNTTAVASSLPIYPDAPLRPTIPDYLAMVGASGSTIVQSREEIVAIVESWGPGRHGIIAAAISDFSTHMFNVVHDGNEVRFLDGHVGLPGDFNFDIRWLRIGVAEVGPLHPSFLATAVSVDAAAPCRPEATGRLSRA